MKKTVTEAARQILSTARSLHAELRQGVLAMRSQRRELHQRAIELKAHRESLHQLAQLIKAEMQESDAAYDSRKSSSYQCEGAEGIVRTLSPRQRRVLEGVLAGRANKAIAFDLGVSTKTIETHRARVMAKFHVGSLADLVRACMAIARLPEPPEDRSDRSRQSA